MRELLGKIFYTLQEIRDYSQRDAKDILHELNKMNNLLSAMHQEMLNQSNARKDWKDAL